MKHYEKLLEFGCFSRGKIAAMLGNDETAGSLLREYQKKGYIERVRRDLYVVISLETKQPVVSRYQIGCAVFDDAVIANHSAFEVFGFANQVFYEVYVCTGHRFPEFQYNGVSYHRLAPKSGMDTVYNSGVRVTSLEQTVIDSIADFEKITGLEETLRCIMLIPSLDEGKLVRILGKLGNGYLWQKCGYVLEELNGMLHLSPEFFKACHDHIAGSKRTLLKETVGPVIWNRKWDLYVPESIRTLTDKGGDFRDTV